MTDNEIIKALECCGKYPRNCAECPLCRTNTEPCAVPLARNALNLINRQKEEIERLKKENLELEIEKFKCNTKVGTLTGRITLMERDIPFIKAEAIKDFAEKANKIFTEIYNKHIFGANDLEAEEKDAIINFSDDVTRGFDNLVKEMIGEQQ